MRTTGGVGEPPYRSTGASGYAIDELGVYDVPAAVTQATGKHPVWVGHSMGATMAFIYLEGARFEENGHVMLDKELAGERNAQESEEGLLGFIDLDGPVVPMGETRENPIVWTLLARRTFLGPLPDGVHLLMGTLSSIQGSGVLNPQNLDPEVARYLSARIKGVSTGVLAQYQDAKTFGRLMEDYQNGPGNARKVFPGPPNPKDGYTDYSSGLGVISLPAFVAVSEGWSQSYPDRTRMFFDGKTKNPLDTLETQTGTSHIDLVMGKRAPLEHYPQIIAWLNHLMASGQAQGSPNQP